MKPTLSVAIIAKNEAENLEKILPTIEWADEIIVVTDPESTDKTADVAKKHGAKVVNHPWQGFGRQKNFALTQTTKEWILSLDADEALSEQTHQQIMEAIDQAQFDAYYLPRRTFFAGTFIRHGGWYPDWQLRLFRRGVTQFEDKPVHERVIETQKTGYLPQAPLDHYSYKDLTDYLGKLNRYTSIEAETRRNQTRNWLFLIAKPWYRFFQVYVFGLGFLDGLAGLIVGVMSAVYVFVVHAKISELQGRKK